ncbi:MAG TPA: hypothetical protein VFV50_05015 [Bdellovibrionales bacterium]|nr:hypothetical protein [Bdellovibrionales bacterium]
MMKPIFIFACLMSVAFSAAANTRTRIVCHSYYDRTQEIARVIEAGDGRFDIRLAFNPVQTAEWTGVPAVTVMQGNSVLVYSLNSILARGTPSRTYWPFNLMVNFQNVVDADKGAFGKDTPNGFYGKLTSRYFRSGSLTLSCQRY